MEYQFGHEWEKERERLASIEEFNDPGTIRHLETLGVGPGGAASRSVQGEDR